MASVLLRPLNYLTISHESGRLHLFNWWIPGLVSAVLVLGGTLLMPTINLFHKDGVMERLLSFVQNMPGFYLAALAAVATFGKEDLDRLMPGKPPKAIILYNGQRFPVELTRRRFLSMMFAYLTVLSFGLTLGLICAVSLPDLLKGSISVASLEILRALGAFLLLLFAAQMLTITLWGLSYLGERMHTPDR